MIPINDSGKIGIISQNRVLADKKCHIVHEFPAGWMKSDSIKVTKKQVEENANRELQEEIGYKAKNLEFLIEYRLGNFVVIPYYVLLATKLEKSRLKADKGEIIQVEWLSIEKAEEKLLIKQIPTAQVYIAFRALKDYLKKK